MSQRTTSAGYRLPDQGQKTRNPKQRPKTAPSQSNRLRSASSPVNWNDNATATQELKNKVRQDEIWKYTVERERRSLKLW